MPITALTDGWELCTSSLHPPAFAPFLLGPPVRAMVEAQDIPEVEARGRVESIHRPPPPVAVEALRLADAMYRERLRAVAGEAVTL